MESEELSKVCVLISDSLITNRRSSVQAKMWIEFNGGDINLQSV